MNPLAVGPRRKLLCAVAVAVAGVFGSAAPAGAEPTVSVTTPAGDRYSAGQPLPLLIQITGARATEGTVTVRVEGVETVSERFEVAGGATKTVIVVTDTLPWGGGVVVDVDSSDGDLTVRPRLIDDRESELVGVLGSMVDRGLPATTRTATGDRPARLYPVPDVVLNEGAGALQVFDSIVGSSDDLIGMPENALAGLRQWTAGGGRLVLDDATGTSLRGFTLASEGDRVNYGFGTVTFTDGRLRRGDVDGLISTSIKIRAGEVMGVDPGMSGRILLDDAGIKVPGIGALLGLVGVYIIAVGPLLFLVLRRSERQPLAWALVPALSAVTIGLVYVVGRAQRSDVEVAHATVVADVAGALIERSEILVASSNGGFVGVDLSTGFENAGQLFTDFGGGGLVRPVAQRDSNIGLDLNPGEASRIIVERVTDGATAPESPLAVTAQLHDRSLTGTVTNTGEVSLTSVQVAAGNEVFNIDALDPGASAEFSFVDRFAHVPVLDDRLVQRIDQGAFDRFGRIDGGAVNAGALISWIQRFPASRATAQVLAVGWTAEPPAPVRTDDGEMIERGRTAFVTVVPVSDPTSSAVAYGEARTELQRVWDFEMTDVGPRGFVEAPSELAMTVPEGSDLDAGFVLEVPADVSGIELWNGTRWEASSSNIEAGVLAVPDGAVIDGRLQVRVGYSDFGRSAMPVLRSALPGERPAEGVG